ncbi:MAG: hypothetical protein K2N82_00410 [Lachnospiraceae bacterium]|nr:hypothetical protein [Lachnospiraceae bacterium]
MHKHGSLLALFLFPQDEINCQGQNRFVDHHTQYGMETLKRPFLFYCQKCPQGLYPHKRLDKNASVNGEKKKGGKKNE